MGFLTRLIGLGFGSLPTEAYNPSVAPTFSKLPLSAHFLASGVKGPRPITEDLASGGAEPRPIAVSASGVYRTEAISSIYVPKLREPSLFIIFSLATSPSPPATSVSHISIALSIASEQQVLLRHRPALVWVAGGVFCSGNFDSRWLRLQRRATSAITATSGKVTGFASQWEGDDAKVGFRVSDNGSQQCSAVNLRDTSGVSMVVRGSADLVQTDERREAHCGCWRREAISTSVATAEISTVVPSACRMGFLTRLIGLGFGSLPTEAYNPSVAPTFSKLPLSAHFLASGVKGPRPITEDLASGGAEPRPIAVSASGVYRTEAISSIYVPKLREPSLFIIFSLATSPSPPATSVSHISIALSIASEQQVLLRHRPALVWVAGGVFCSGNFDSRWLRLQRRATSAITATSGKVTGFASQWEGDDAKVGFRVSDNGSQQCSAVNLRDTSGVSMVVRGSADLVQTDERREAHCGCWRREAISTSVATAEISTVVPSARIVSVNSKTCVNEGAMNVRWVREGTVSEKVRALGASVCCV
ncbi:hypothetical protein DEO72_LG8g2169 [Vigna unguiculata]|uniref:Uncharacterized protein n=1 Tax=Vigna unguiculata TaxID=3917 RepID=A0A4D6MRN8_VIGUN|nr:hypothetical protein DEO72_LG8g2169 [Vigna unguiculata]